MGFFALSQFPPPPFFLFLGVPAGRQKPGLFRRSQTVRKYLLPTEVGYWRL